MKNLRNKMITMVAGVLFASLLPAAAEAQDWQTSTMPGSGSEYSSQVTAPGASYVGDMANTTEANSPGRPTGKRRSFDNNQDPGNTSDTSSPVGEPWVLLAFAAGAAAVIAARRRRGSAEA